MKILIGYLNFLDHVSKLVNADNNVANDNNTDKQINQFWIALYYACTVMIYHNSFSFVKLTSIINVVQIT